MRSKELRWLLQTPPKKCKCSETNKAYVYAKWTTENPGYHGKFSIEIKKDSRCSDGYILDKSTHKISETILHNCEYSKEFLLETLINFDNLEETLSQLNEIWDTLKYYTWKDHKPSELTETTKELPDTESIDTESTESLEENKETEKDSEDDSEDDSDLTKEIISLID
jgi:hypothetical protein